MSQTHEFRETWLHSAAIAIAEEILNPQGIFLSDKVRYSTGGTGRKTSLGVCHDPTMSADGHYEIFIAPSLDVVVAGLPPEQDNQKSWGVLDTLVHEMIHVAVGLKCGHKGEFVRAAKAAGLAGKMTSTYAGPELAAHLNAVHERLGGYPHGALGSVSRPQNTNQKKLACTCCGYITYATIGSISVWGMRRCHSGTELHFAPPQPGKGRKRTKIL